jgi:hypothetical protein
MTETKAPAGVSAILKLGEERMTALLTQLLSNEAFVAALQSALGRAVSAKGTLDRGVISVLSAVNIPTVEDVQLMQNKLTELEESMADLAVVVEKLEARLAESGTGAAGASATRRRKRRVPPGDAG